MSQSPPLKEAQLVYSIKGTKMTKDIHTQLSFLTSFTRHIALVVSKMQKKNYKRNTCRYQK